MTPPVVETRNLTKRYGNFTALHDLNLSIERGSIYGFIGPNGAGKTTTMRIIATLLEPTGGQAWVSGYPVTQEPREVRRRIGYMPDFFGVYDNMKVWEYLDFFAAAYHVPQPRRKPMIDDLLALVELTAKRDSFVEELSRGMKQRLCLARTLVHEPELLILDEPASGLDPHARIELRELLKALRALGKTILVSSHILTELAEMCTHVAIIERGHLLVNGSVADILQNMRPTRDIYVRVLDRAPLAMGIVERFQGVVSVQALPPGYKPGKGRQPAQPTAQQNVPPQPGALPPPPPPPPPNATLPQPPQPQLSTQYSALSTGFAVPPVGPATIHVKVSGDDLLLNAMLAQLVHQGVPVFGFEESMGDLEDIFLRTTKGLVQ
ncbi:MAG TPA: ABC transporter ATP-binding protein [Chloroflexia bacterium]|nr:ABC transporter ATP-binding protein [Chloroflexia bacterium]